MKRMSILVLITCVFTQQIALAYSHGSCCERVQYSMYAFSHKNPSGLIPGHIKYSPHAFGFNHSGFVNNWTQYSVHAFGFNHNGLISEYGPFSLNQWKDQTTDLNQNRLTKAIDRLATSIDRAKTHCHSPHRTRYTRSRTGYRHIEVTPSDLTSDNPRILMRAYLNTHIPGQFRVSNLLRMDQEVVSFNLVIDNQNLIIKYWNPAKIKSINEAANQQTEQLSDYMKKWVRIENYYDESGTKVVHIMATEQNEILKKLSTCLQTTTM